VTAVIDLPALAPPSAPLVVDQPAEVIVEPERHAPERHAPELFGEPKPPPSALLTLCGSAAVWLGIALVGWRLLARPIRSRVGG
jgi:hypothetical protein